MNADAVRAARMAVKVQEARFMATQELDDRNPVRRNATRALFTSVARQMEVHGRHAEANELREMVSASAARDAQ